jgi:hypothetical protein
MSRFRYKNRAIKIEKIKPNAAANFFGGANMGFGFNFKYLETLFAIYAKGDVTLVKERNAKSIASITVRKIQLYANATKVTITTRRATILTIFSFN